MASPSLVVFGPQTPTPSAEHLARLRSILINDKSLATFLSAIQDLPALWPKLLEAEPSLARLPGLKLLEDIKQWTASGELPLSAQGTLPNIQSTPLTVIIHIVEYFNYLKEAKDGVSHMRVLANAQPGGIQGFCTGFLAATALVCSKNEEELAEMAGVALRLAVCIGAIVDLDGAFANPPRGISCLAIRWPAATSKDQVSDILKRHQDAYISVLSDATSVTITVPSAASYPLLRELAEKGIKAKPISLNGRFHNSDHKDAVDTLKTLCKNNAGLRFPTDRTPFVPLRSNFTAKIITEGVLHEIALESLLVEVSDWYSTISESTAALSRAIQLQNSQVLVVGLVDCIPRPLLAASNLEIINLRGMKIVTTKNTSKDGLLDGSGITSFSSEYTYPDDAIAIIGMGCRYPGADSLDEYWDVIKSGDSMIGDLPKGRFPTKGLRRTPNNNISFRGNFIRDADAFDHQFFKRSSREATSMDPQHRLSLQVAYETLENAEYFSKTSPAKDIGCYMGVAASDYEDNVASHLPTAFSVLGMVRAFIGGKLSHFFGFSGPALVFDTACSSSAVAIHTACKAIQAGDCSMAIAGGVNVITSPILHQNLAAANFLSPTGESKAFDAKADGYCRGEGAGMVLLKRLSSAIADNDNILGVIVGSAVNQNDNCDPITVPVSTSQTALYKRVLERASMDARTVSFVEAHGTGTPKGDPIECASIRQVFGNQSDRKLYFGSVKGNIGHTEAASGVAGLIKVLLMMRHKTIGPQASFTRLNPNITPLEPSNMEISRKVQNWNPKFLAACINNYGAAGSNAAMAVCQPPFSIKTGPQDFGLSSRFPIFISAKSATSLRAYCRALKNFTMQNFSVAPEQLLAGIAFGLARRQNRSFPHVLTAVVASLSELLELLDNYVTSESEVGPNVIKEKPVVLVFSGQTGSTVNLSEEAYKGSSILSCHLDQCDETLQSMGLKGLFPRIFSPEPIEDVVELHCIAFSMQYSCAMTWIDSGLKVDTLVGHSFGQLTALCVAGVLSLGDALRLISGRATLIKEKWGTEKGSMIAVDAELRDIERLIAETAASGANLKVEIACYNGPTNYVLVGSESSLRILEDLAASSALIKTRRLAVTHGFHSQFVENILSDYSILAETCTYNKCNIRIESCSKGSSWTDISADLVAGQSREPVYFGDAISRIEQRLGQCTWIEAGSNTAAIPMVRQALQSSASSDHSFHSVKLGGSDSIKLLADATINLWKAGVQVQYWPFHSSQRQDYQATDLPPYQFDKPKHWLEYIDRHEKLQPTPAPVPVETKAVLLSFLKFSDSHKTIAEFSVNQASEEYKVCVQGHAVLASTLCPASLYVELAARAATILNPDISLSTQTPHLANLEMFAPLGIDLSRKVCVSLSQSDKKLPVWEYSLSSHACDDPSRLTTHAKARISYVSMADPKISVDFARYERLINYPRCEALFNNTTAEAIQGSLVYKMFAKVVLYSDIYRGVTRISSTKGEIAGQVIMPPNEVNDLKSSITHPLAVDNFTQVAGLHVNSLEECGENEVFVCTKIDELCVGKNLKSEGPESGPWLVYSNFDRRGDRELVNDIYIFDAVRKTMIMTILGVRFTKVVINSLRKALSRANSVEAPVDLPQRPSLRLDLHLERVESERSNKNAGVSERPSKPNSKKGAQKKRQETEVNTMAALQKLLNEVADIPLKEMTEDARLEDLGIDSLMATEVLSAIKETFKISIPATEFSEILDLKSLCERINPGGKDAQPEISDSSSYETNSNFGSSETADSSPLSTVGGDTSYLDLTLKLSKLVSEHLDATNNIGRETVLGEAGLDSLLGIELGNDIEKAFGQNIDMMSLDPQTTFGELCDMVFPRRVKFTPAGTPALTLKAEESQQSNGSVSTMLLKVNDSVSRKQAMTESESQNSLADAPEDFASVRSEFNRYAEETGFAHFRSKVYPKQAKLVLAYVLEAFAALGYPLDSMKAGDRLAQIPHIPKHAKVMLQYYKVLEEGSLITISNGEMIRTATPVDKTKASQLFGAMIVEFPQHRSELKLLNSTGSKLADCLSGKIDPLQILFRSKVDRDLLEDVYTNSPMFATGTKMLGNFFIKTFSKHRGSKKVRILELGAGTGGTTKYIVDLLISHGIDFTYTFTDLSSSMVANAKRNFARYDCMEYMVLDVEKTPPEKLMHSYDTILSSNCVHATKSLLNSSTNVHKMLRKDGFLCLLELTRNLYWLDCVFGLLEGWWLFDDGRKHVLADELRWKGNLTEAGFKHVDWTDDESEESDQFRVIAAFVSEPKTTIAAHTGKDEHLPTKETVEFHKIDETSLFADIYYPNQRASTQIKKPIALMIHGGGHIMLSRKDIRPKQTRLLLDHGFLPVSVDYRLCPEVTLTEGPITDVCTALQWARAELPSLILQRSDIRPDGNKVVVVGWSTGGTLSMTLAWSAPQRGLKPPDAILAFYCPTDYEAEFWRLPNFPEATGPVADQEYDLLEGVQDHPITGYNVPADKRAVGGWMSTADPRSRIALHMNWKGQALPTLLDGLPSKNKLGAHERDDVQKWLSRPQPDAARIAAVSPYAQIRAGNYKVPTFLIHGTEDDLIPWQHSQRVRDALAEQKVPAGLAVVDEAVHLFDLYRDADGKHWEAVRKGYNFLFSQLGM